MTQLKIGDLVRQIMPAPLEGRVTKFVGDETSMTWHVHFAVAELGPDGKPTGATHDRALALDQLELLEREAAAPAP
jgi:hypothetical protein